MELSSPLSIVKGLGPAREKVLNEQGLFTVSDILYYFPRRHLDRTVLTAIKKLEKGNIVNIIASVETYGERSIRRGKIFQVIVSDGTGLLTLSWFNGVRYIKNMIKKGQRLAIFGKVDWYKGFTITHPEFEILDDTDDVSILGGVIPIYPLTKEFHSVGLEQRRLRSIIKKVLESKLLIPEIFSQLALNKFNLIPLDKALNLIHFSENIGELDLAIRRLKFDEHFFLQMLLALRKNTTLALSSKRLIDVGPYFRPISETLDFELTKAQKKVIQDVHLDMKNDHPMNRLVQGDVGCGKTIVAILISSIAVGNNVQVAIMAPTEILARQHFHTFKEQLNKVNITCALLIGKMRKSDRDKVISGLKIGKISIVVGTHALIQKDVAFHELGLVIIDEQHRFGVNQRSSLLEKGDNPHSMAMTATPIPRTLAITYHGDMDISIIDELPLNRIPIITKIVDPQRLNKVYKFMRDEVSKGRQCIVVYPLVEESEKLDLAAAVEAHDELSKIQFSNLNVGLVHGKMKAEEKDDIIKNFENNKINILVSTTVIEVGIDIPNATVMLVEHAERFGLTQLHQLRGRVGRGINKSYCILVRRNITDTSKNRLSVMEKTNDGFIIADEDLKLRGPGEFFGLRQSGFFQFKIADMVQDGSLLRQARSSAFDLIVQDQNLTNDSNKRLREWFISDYDQYLDTIKLSR